MFLFTKDFWRYCYRFIKTIAIRFNNENFTYRSSALTYTTLLALVPLMTLLFAILSIFPVFKETGADLQTFLFENFVPASRSVIQDNLLKFSDKTKELSLVGSAMLIVTSIMLLMTIEGSFNAVWKVKKNRSIVSAFLRYWTILSLAPIFLALSFNISLYVFSSSFVSSTTEAWLGKNFLLSLLPFLFSGVGLTILYIVLPNCHVKWRHGIVGGFIAAIFFEFTKLGFSFYIKSFPSYQLVYGAFAAIPIFLLWIYISWTIVLVGAAIVHTLDTMEYRDGGVPIDSFTHAFLCLGAISRAQSKSKELTLADLKDLKKGYPVEDVQSLMRVLIEKDLVTKTASNGYVLANDTKNITLKLLHETLPYVLPDTEQTEKLESLRYSKYCKLLRTLNKEINAALDQSVLSLYDKNAFKIVAKKK